MWSRRAFVTVPIVLASPLAAATDPTTKLRIQVTDLNDKPVERASVVVKFLGGRSIRKLGKKAVKRWELRTNQEGIADMPSLPQGEVQVQVIADRYQTFGDTFEVYEDERTIHIQLKPPQQQYSVYED